MACRRFQWVHSTKVLRESISHTRIGTHVYTSTRLIAEGSFALSGPRVYPSPYIGRTLSEGKFTECLSVSEGDASKALLRARAHMRLRRFREALEELRTASNDSDDTEATALALRLHCSAALMEWPEVARIDGLTRSMRNVSEATSAEIAVARASAAFYRGDPIEMRSTLLAMNAHAAPRFVAWQLCLLSLAASLQRQYVEQARTLERMVRFIEETPAAMEVALLANAAQTLADLAREVFWPILSSLPFGSRKRSRGRRTSRCRNFLTRRSIASAMRCVVRTERPSGHARACGLRNLATVARDNIR